VNPLESRGIPAKLLRIVGGYRLRVTKHLRSARELGLPIPCAAGATIGSDRSRKARRRCRQCRRYLATATASPGQIHLLLCEIDPSLDVGGVSAPPAF